MPAWFWSLCILVSSSISSATFMHLYEMQRGGGGGGGDLHPEGVWYQTRTKHLCARFVFFHIRRKAWENEFFDILGRRSVIWQEQNLWHIAWYWTGTFVLQKLFLFHFYLMHNSVSTSLTNNLLKIVISILEDAHSK